MPYSYHTLVFLFVTLITLSSAKTTDVAGKIATNPACKDDVTRLCRSEVLPNDLAVLDCLQNRRSDSDSDIKIECHSVCFVQSSYFCNVTLLTHRFFK